MNAVIAVAVAKHLNSEQVAFKRTREIQSLELFKWLVTGRGHAAGLEKAISSHRNIPDLFRDLACRVQDLFKFRDIGVMLHDETRNVMRLYVLEACEDLLREPVTEVPIEGSIAG
jgi:hypothetical protein